MHDRRDCRGKMRRGMNADAKPGSVTSEQGATLVEFALCAMVLFAMLFGSLQISLALFSYNFVSEAAREATRYAIVRGSQCTGMPDCNATSAQIQAYVQTLNYPGINVSNLTATATWLSATGGPPNTTWVACTAGPGITCNAPGNAVNVVVTYTFPVNIPLVPPMNFSLSNTSQMVISQ